MTNPCTPFTTAVRTECLQHSAARLLAVLGTATACIPLAEGSDSLILVGLPEQIAKLLPAAANKAAEEGDDELPECCGGTGLQTSYLGEGVCLTCMAEAEDRRRAQKYVDKALAADRAARPVANKAEAEQDAARYQFLRHADLDEMKRIYWPEGEVPSGAEFDAAIDHALGCVATPPATTGASTVLTDERIAAVFKELGVAGEPMPNTYKFARAIEREVAAQAGQVAVPEGWTITKESNVITIKHPAVGKSTLASLALETASQVVLYHLADCLLAPSPAKESK